MKYRISLKLFVSLAFLLLSVVLVTGYSLLSAHYYHMGMDSVTANNMEETARSYVMLVSPDKRIQFENFRGYRISSDWNLMPPDLQRVFGTKPPAQGLSIKVEKDNWFTHPDAVYFVYRYQDENETLYVTRRGTRATVPPLIGRNAAESRKMLLVISFSIAGLLGISFLLLLRRVSRPVASLGQWARSLNAENLSESPPDFSYPELNDLAYLIRNSLSSVQESLDREHRFLRYASHELRTPITVMSNNIELLHKIKETTALERSVPLDKAIERMDRASLNMQYLTETLLWLSRKELQTLPGSQIELDSLLKEMVDEMKYLLDRKGVELKVETHPFTAFLPEFPVRIVLGNLIRNAFQHTWEGCITIQQQDNHVVIFNPQSPAGNDQQELGFGLGLQLTMQLAHKLCWKYIDESDSYTHKVSIIFGDGSATQSKDTHPG